MSKIRFVGDVHGKAVDYVKLVKDQEFSIQVGDLGFHYTYLPYLNHTRHIVVPGNHDNYYEVDKYPHFLTTFGSHVHGGLNFFYVRGAFSIDWQWRLNKEHRGYEKSWWQEEELSYGQLQQAIDLYTEVKPDFMVTHEAPRSIIKNITDGRVLRDFGYNPETFTTRTSEALDRMLDAHRPKIWVFGHYHRRLDKEIDGTRFVCLEELGVLDYVNS